MLVVVVRRQERNAKLVLALRGNFLVKYDAKAGKYGNSPNAYPNLDIIIQGLRYTCQTRLRWTILLPQSFVRQRIQILSRENEQHARMKFHLAISLVCSALSRVTILSS
jgi:hypothetical protein